MLASHVKFPSLPSFFPKWSLHKYDANMGTSMGHCSNASLIIVFLNNLTIFVMPLQNMTIWQAQSMTLDQQLWWQFLEASDFWKQSCLYTPCHQHWYFHLQHNDYGREAPKCFFSSTVQLEHHQLLQEMWHAKKEKSQFFSARWSLVTFSS